MGGTSTSLAGLTSVTSTAFTGSLQGNASNIIATSNTTLTSLSNLNTVGTITGGTWNGTAIANNYLANPSFYVGTTSISLGRTSASQTLTGVSIDGNAATVTGGVYTSGDQTIGGVKTFSNKVVFASTVDNRPQFPGGMLGLDTGDGDFDIWGISRDYYPSHATSANAWGLRWYGTGNEFRFVGGGTNRVVMDMDTGDIVSTGIISGTTIYGTWNGTAIANNYLANSSFYIGTTSISLGRGSASQSLTGVNIDGTAGGETLATVTSRGASTSAALTLSSTSLTMSSHYYTLMYSTNDTYVHFYPSGGNSTNYSAVNWRFWTTAGGTKVLRAAGDGTFTWDSSVVKTVANSSYSTTFSSVTSVTVTHNLGTKDVAVFVYDSSDNMFWPSSIVTTSTSVVTVTFASSRSGRVVVVR